MISSVCRGQSVIKALQSPTAAESTRRPIDEPQQIKMDEVKAEGSEEDDGFEDMKINKKNLFKSTIGGKPSDNPFQRYEGSSDTEDGD